mmetsp:Transcript_12629/g.29051  ORF Transcript_12629/g.29051 Transcript_12629/m.29051 type:complete len:249 (-) Transcript_12629:204-950(-)|eukprot:CAMPEP_0114548404 /NCGR_PEP_ID=MMETSP0114-20121206/4961_1 /TAXON_ID=31324 /ORGANISM="Goniomonas sp, Strain m" /LENGTH=248 /DNA_ID=CAMNT_0001732987 /DNA_START=60 /DNA_END=806 /DNA_ORIENTATION=+
MDEREGHILMAKISESAERYDDMVNTMNSVAELGVELTVEERNLLTIAYNNCIGARRCSWHLLCSIEQKEANKGDENRVSMARKYREKVEDEVRNICNGLLTILERHLIVTSTTGESKTYYLKMKGDFWRYLSDVETGPTREEAFQHAILAYEAAQGVCMSELPPTSPLRLQLALNFSVFCTESLNSPSRGRRIATQAFDDAIREIDSQSEKDYRDSSLVMQLLRDSLEEGAMSSSSVREPQSLSDAA